MMTSIRFHFRQGDAGWSELYYLDGKTGKTLLQEIQEFRTDRVKVLSKSAVLTYGTIKKSADGTGPGENFDFASPGTAGDNLAGNVEIAAVGDAYGVNALLPFRTPTGVRRNVSIRGMPDTWVVVGEGHGEPLLNGHAQNKLATFQAKLVTAGTRLQIRRRVTDGVGLPRAINNISAVDGGVYTIDTVAAHGFKAGDKVSFKDVDGHNLGRLSGILRVTKVDGLLSFSVNRGPRPELGPIIFNGGGTVSGVAHVFETADRTSEMFRVSSRDVGRPFGLHRGRRSASK